jgi:hypothetical protein
MGLLSSLLGSAGVDVGGGGILGQLGNSLSQNSGALLGFASGGPEGMVQGRRSDMLAAAQRQEQETGEGHGAGEESPKIPRLFRRSIRM